MNYKGQIEGQYGNREDKKKLSGKYGRVGHSTCTIGSLNETGAAVSGRK
jgi:hypothetical protein